MKTLFYTFALLCILTGCSSDPVSNAKESNDSGIQKRTTITIIPANEADCTANAAGCIKDKTGITVPNSEMRLMCHSPWNLRSGYAYYQYGSGSNTFIVRVDWHSHCLAGDCETHYSSEIVTTTGC